MKISARYTAKKSGNLVEKGIQQGQDSFKAILNEKSKYGKKI